jgi:peptide deformylase
MMNLIKYPNPILTTPCSNFDFDNPPFDPEAMASDLIKACKENNSVGLSANQVGLPYNIFVMVGEPNFVCYNPKIVNLGDEIDNLEEACPSFPGIAVKIKRSKEVRLRFQTPSGVVTTKTFNGLSARTIQHEMDHLYGDIFYKRANRYHLELAMKKRNKIYGK